MRAFCHRAHPLDEPNVLISSPPSRPGVVRRCRACDLARRWYADARRRLGDHFADVVTLSLAEVADVIRRNLRDGRPVTAGLPELPRKRARKRARPPEVRATAPAPVPPPDWRAYTPGPLSPDELQRLRRAAGLVA
ncbi:hypothetical protein [Amycolatopsis thermoflava]|uniref:hypothetical protein n=1 Tax=Amycolatopsis thermoflava TaxID=84480 RepID=UPI0036508371